MPSVVELAKILPPQSYMGEITKEEMDNVISNSIMETKYRELNNSESTYAKLTTIKEEKIKNEEAAKLAKEQAKKEEEERKLKEKQKKEEEKAKREKERKRKNSIGYKLGKKAVDKTVNKALNKGVKALFGETTKSNKKKSSSVGETLAKEVIKNLFK